MKALIDIQQKLKAPKGRENTFGGYQYRNAEDILREAKPLLAEAGCTLTISDEIVAVLDRIYVKATVTLSDGKVSISTSAFAREALIKKGMDDSQITGAASSYARKYALNGLFAIDDTKDADNQKPDSIEEQIDACANINQLHELWRKLSKKEQQENKDIFGAAKSKFAEAA